MNPIQRMIFPAALAFAVALPLSAAAQVEEAADTVPADTVRLRFGWAPGMQARVEYEQVRVRNTGERRDSIRIASTYRMRVDAHPEGLVVGYSDVEWTELPALEGEAGELFRAALQAGSGGGLRHVIGAGGDFVRVDGVEEVHQEIVRTFEGMLARLDSAGIGGDAIRSMLSEETLTMSAADEWNALVGAWLDADLEVGGAYELESAFTAPMFGDVEIPTFMEFEVVGRVPCNEAQAEHRCVELWMANYPDGEALGQAITGFIERMGVPAEEAQGIFEVMNVEAQVTLVTEPETLRPHRLEQTRIVRLTPDQAAEPAQVETRRYVYRYPR